MPKANVNALGRRNAIPIQVWYNGTDTLKVGYALCYQRDYASGSTTAQNIERRGYYVQKPSYTNRMFPAGIVTKVPATAAAAGWVEVLPLDEAVANDVKVWTDENITYGDILGIVPGQYGLGKWTVGKPLAQAVDSQDRSTTAGLVTCVIGIDAMPTAETLSAKRIHYFDDFVGRHNVSATADIADYLLSGTSAAAAFGDSFGPDQATAGKQAAGVLNLTTNTTNQANLMLNGEPFRMDVNKSLFFRCRFATDLGNATCTAFVGISLTDTSYFSTKPTDYIGFETTSAADLVFTYVKNGTTGVVSNTGLATLTADTFVEVAFLVRNRGSGGMTISAWVDGVAKTITSTTTEIVDDEALTLMADIVGGAAVILRLDTVEVCNYVGLAS